MMGRTFAALRKGNNLRITSGVKAAAPIVDRGPGEDMAAGGPEEEVPFIEVGGPGATFEASQSVLRSKPIRVPKPLAADATRRESRPQSIPLPPAFAGAVADPLAIAFQPLPAAIAQRNQNQSRIASEVIAYHQPDHGLSQQYRSLLSGLLGQLPLGGAQVLLFAAAGAGSGTTTVLVNLAVTYARQSKKCVIVDANLKRPAIASRLGLANSPGLHEVLSGRFPLLRALRETAQTSLLALTSGDPLSGGAVWPPASALRSILHQLRRHVDLVLVDGPSWDEGPELASLIAACDAVCLVLKPGEVETPAVTDLLRLIPHVGGHVGGYIVAQRGPSAEPRQQAG